MVGLTVLAQGWSVRTCLASSAFHSATCLSFQAWSVANTRATEIGSSDSCHLRYIRFAFELSFINVGRRDSVTREITREAPSRNFPIHFLLALGHRYVTSYCVSSPKSSRAADFFRDQMFLSQEPRTFWPVETILNVTRYG